MSRTIQLPSESALPGEFRICVTNYNYGEKIPRGEVQLADERYLFMWLQDHEVTPEALAPIAQESAIKMVRLARTPLAPGSLRVIAALPGLVDLGINQSNFTPEDCATIASTASSLTKLEIYNLPMTDAHLAALASCSTLQELTIVSNFPPFATDDAFEHIARLPALTHLHWVGNSNITGAGLSALASSRRLDYLGLQSTPKLEERSISALAAVETLTNVSLSVNKHLTDGVCRALAACPSLEQVHLRFVSKMTDAGLEALGALPRLREVHLSLAKDQKKISKVGIAAFKERHPGVKVVRS